CASATDSACWAANSCRLRISSSGSPPKGKLNPPSITAPSGRLLHSAGALHEPELVTPLDLRSQLLDRPAGEKHRLRKRGGPGFAERLLESQSCGADGVEIGRAREPRRG